jgi:hypothetical protein
MAVKSTPPLFAGHKLKLLEKAEEESPNSDDRAETNHFASLRGADCDVSNYVLGFVGSRFMKIIQQACIPEEAVLLSLT